MHWNWAFPLSSFPFDRKRGRKREKEGEI